jgi:hypothetical protein
MEVRASLRQVSGFAFMFLGSWVLGLRVSALRQTPPCMDRNPDALFKHAMIIPTDTGYLNNAHIDGFLHYSATKRYAKGDTVGGRTKMSEWQIARAY